MYRSSVIIIFGYISRFIPFGFWSVGANLKQIPAHFEEAGILCTLRWSRVVRKIMMPLCKPGLMAGFFIIFILSLGELSTTLLIILPGKSTLPLKIYNLMHYGAEHMVAALSLMLIGFIVVFSALFLKIYKFVGVKNNV
ncbi:MAG: ABC transporter permease subunit [bacterium]